MTASFARPIKDQPRHECKPTTQMTTTFPIYINTINTKIRYLAYVPTFHRSFKANNIHILNPHPLIRTMFDTHSFTQYQFHNLPIKFNIKRKLKCFPAITTQLDIFLHKANKNHHIFITIEKGLFFSYY